MWLFVYRYQKQSRHLRIRIGHYVVLVLVSVDFGLFSTFGSRAFHDGLLFIFTALTSIAVIVGFMIRRLAHHKLNSES